jgi:adenine/guanine phosphoribosyltransferase-like PRPP-binding protein
VDDVLTTGQTLTAIAAAVKASNPNVRVFAVVLAKQESLDFLPFETAEEANARVPVGLDRIWRQHAP